MTEPEKSWLAAVIDCEGCLGLGSNGHTEQFRKDGTPCPSNGLRGYKELLMIVNTDKELIHRVCSLINYPRNVRILPREGSLGKKTCYEVWIRGNALKEILKNVYPYLICKRKIAERIIRWIDFIEERKHFSWKKKREMRPQYDNMANWVRQEMSKFKLVTV